VCHDWQWSAGGLPPFYIECLRARPEVGLWYPRQQAAWSGRQDDLQSGDEAPHSKDAFGAMLELVVA